MKLKQLFIIPILTIATLINAHMAISAEQKADTLTIMTHDSFQIDKKLINNFEKQNNIKIKIFKAGDSGEALVKAILSRNNPMADVFFGVDNTFFSRAIKADIFQPYNSPQLKNIDDDLKLDPQNRLLPMDYGDVCLNYDKTWFKKHNLNPPTSLDDLIKPAYKGLTVVQNPASSSPGLAFLLTTIGCFGENNYLQFWQKLKANDLLVTNGWEEAYFSHFTAASKGNRPIVVSYATSPAATVFYAEEPMTAPPTAAITSPGTSFRQIEFIGILKNSKNRKMAEKVVDFFLSQNVQEDIPLKMFMYPANNKAALPEIFIKHSQQAKQPVQVSPLAIEQKREKWIQEWTKTVIR